MKKLILGLLFVIGCSHSTPAPQPSPVDCSGVWGACQGACGEGKGSQLFSVVLSAKNGGKACEAADGSVRSCTASVCPVNPPGWVAANLNDLVAGGVAGSYCITVHAVDGSVSQAPVPNGFGPCLIVFEHADGSYWTSK